MLDDITISKNAVLKPITDIANKLGVNENDLELYGKYKAKIHLEKSRRVASPGIPHLRLGRYGGLFNPN